MKDTLGFFWQIARRWRTTGAIAPSGPVLAKAMAVSVGHLKPGEVIIELGPGTGAFTEALVKRHPDNRVVAIEYNAAFVPALRRRVPKAIIVEGCASRLLDHLTALDIRPEQVGAVVSGLPLLVLPPDLARGVFNAAAEILAPGRRFIQFTYSARAWRRFDPTGFHPESPRRVWANFPPAVILPFTRAA